MVGVGGGLEERYRWGVAGRSEERYRWGGIRAGAKEDNSGVRRDSFVKKRLSLPLALHSLKCHNLIYEDQPPGPQTLKTRQYTHTHTHIHVRWHHSHTHIRHIHTHTLIGWHHWHLTHTYTRDTRHINVSESPDWGPKSDVCVRCG